MKSYRKELWFETPTRRAFINITPQVKEAVRESGVKEGLCLVNAMHITASVYINDDEPGLLADYEAGSKDWPRMNRSPATAITAPGRTTATRT